jgi:hypothetical protein
MIARNELTGQIAGDLGGAEGVYIFPIMKPEHLTVHLQELVAEVPTSTSPLTIVNPIGTPCVSNLH